MIHSAALKLTLAYLAIIMALSIGFSIVVFRLSTIELNRGLRRPPIFAKLQFPQNDYEDFRRAQLAESGQHIRNMLVFFNLGTFIAGGALSYALARRTMEPIEDALERQSRFAADASHELRTPLTAMQTEIEVALRDTKRTPKQTTELLQSNLEEVAKLRTLSDSLLRLARQDGKQLKIEQLPLQPLIKQVVGRFKAEAKRKNISLHYTIPRMSVAADRAALTESVCILVENAIKYSPTDKRVHITATLQNDSVIIDVKDEGIGIAEKDLDRIFHRFYRADSSRSSTTQKGYGLGLSIAEQLIGLHGGR